MRIVYVDDEPAMCRIIARVLARRGAEVITFADPLEALAHLQTHPYDTVVCDQRMPGMTGLELREKLPDDVDFVLVTGEVAFGAEEHPGVRAVLAKPFRPAALLALLGL